MIILFKQLTRHSTFSPSYLINHETVVFPSIVPGKDSYHSQYYAETQGHGPHYLKLHAHTTTQTSRHNLNLFISQPNSSLSTQVERPKAGGVLKTRKYPPLSPIPDSPSTVPYRTHTSHRMHGIQPYIPLTLPHRYLTLHPKYRNLRHLSHSIFPRPHPTPPHIHHHLHTEWSTHARLMCTA